jgi:hypothetical protein
MTARQLVARHRSLVRRYAILLATALLSGGVLAGPASATTPRPAPGQVVAAATDTWLFWQATDHRLWTNRMLEPHGSGDLGGVLTSGPAAVTMTEPDAPELRWWWWLARGRDNAIWYRSWYNISPTPGQWYSLGGRALGAPTASCADRLPGGRPIVWVRGGDGALWRRTIEGPWQRLGGRLASDPAAVPGTEAGCPAVEDVFALGTDLAVWEHVNGAWHRIGGKSSVAPAAAQGANGDTDLFVRGTDNALWMTAREHGTSTWSAWRRVGGALTSPPSAYRFPPDTERSVFVLGSDGNIWHMRNTIGTSTWTWTHVPWRW